MDHHFGIQIEESKAGRVLEVLDLGSGCSAKLRLQHGFGNEDTLVAQRLRDVSSLGKSAVVITQLLTKVEMQLVRSRSHPSMNTTLKSLSDMSDAAFLPYFVTFGPARLVKI